MADYVRSRKPGGAFFFTVVTFQRRRLFEDLRKCETLINIIVAVQQELPFTMDAWVILPDHIHSLWTLPPEDSDYSKRWGLIKAKFSKAVSRKESRSARLTGSRIRHRESTIWQRRFWEHQIRDEKDLQLHLNYIHFNPVKHGLVKSPAQWPYSSFQEYVQRGLYPANWGEQVSLEFSGDFGE
uniref:Transposase n=1 Tax=Desulfobacca acetoxidans TaxID=60893 RepID=A0A7V4GAD6_9BACT